jgi:predicted transcriptional regulator
MIAKECAPSPAREETKKEGLLNVSASSYIYLSIEDVENKILKHLCDNRGWISTKRLFENLGLDVLGMSTAARAIHQLGKRGIIELKANAVRAARGIKRVRE